MTKTEYDTQVRSLVVKFWVITLSASLGIPLLVVLLLVIGAQSLSFGLAMVYVFPPLFIVELCGVKGGSSGVYSNALFEGYIGVGPSSPLGWMLCIAVWFMIGVFIWFITCKPLLLEKPSSDQ